MKPDPGSERERPAFRVRWTAAAVEELALEIRRLFLLNPRAATRTLDQIGELVARLDLFPLSGRVVAEFQEHTLREVVSQKYRIVYRVRPDSVQVLTVFPAKRPLPPELLRGE